MKFSAKIIPTVAIAIFLLNGCGSNTSVTGTYLKPGTTSADVQFKKVFIAAITSNLAMRQKVETTLADAFKSRGYAAVRSIDVAMPDFNNTTGSKSDLVLDKIRESGSDGVLTVALVNQENETRYVQGQSYPVSSYSYYHSFGGYYNNWYGPMYDTGYYTTDKNYFVETNLYDVATGSLIWSAQSKTMNPSDIDDFLNGYLQSMHKQLKKDGLAKDDK